MYYYLHVWKLHKDDSKQLLTSTIICEVNNEINGSSKTLVCLVSVPRLLFSPFYFLLSCFVTIVLKSYFKIFSSFLASDSNLLEFRLNSNCLSCICFPVDVCQWWTDENSGGISRGRGNSLRAPSFPVYPPQPDKRLKISTCAHTHVHIFYLCHCLSVSFMYTNMNTHCLLSRMNTPTSKHSFMSTLTHGHPWYTHKHTHFPFKKAYSCTPSRHTPKSCKLQCVSDGCDGGYVIN